MQKDAFAQLEERIGQAVTRIRTLTEERARLSTRQEELEDQLKMLEGRNQELEGELGELREATGGTEAFEKTRREIETRVEGLLARFAELDEIAGG
jgi:predicted  nucleic acid-binding Zn-ribbon protein